MNCHCPYTEPGLVCRLDAGHRRPHEMISHETAALEALLAAS